MHVNYACDIHENGNLKWQVEDNYIGFRLLVQKKCRQLYSCPHDDDARLGTLGKGSFLTISNEYLSWPPATRLYSLLADFCWVLASTHKSPQRVRRWDSRHNFGQPT